YPQAS
ncbi:peptidase M20/M25/M40 family protein, partial [Vibrio parahaemolyticus V-223/04]